jgi:hypothetical protein
METYQFCDMAIEELLKGPTLRFDDQIQTVYSVAHDLKRIPERVKSVLKTANRLVGNSQLDENKLMSVKMIVLKEL